MSVIRHSTISSALVSALVLGTVALAAPAAAATEPCSVFFDADGDGHDDLAVGTAGEDVSTTRLHPDAGAVTIVKGDAQGRFGSSGSEQLTQESLGMVSQDGDRFGAVVASADLDGDGCGDLAIGMPGQHHAAGAVVVVYGTPTGLDTAHPQLLRQGAAPVGGSAEAGDGFGSALTVAGGLPTGGAAQLWVGAPGEDVGSTKDAGVVTELSGATGSLVGSAGATTFRQGASGVPGSAESGDRFGERLSGGLRRVLVGVPHEDIGSKKDAGLVYVFGVSSQGWATYSQDSAGMPGTAEAGDVFGSSLAQAAGCGQADETWVIGASREDIGSARNAGSVTLWDRGTRKGATVSQGVGGVPDTSESGDTFGATMVTTTVDGGMVAIGAPGEDTAGDADSGTITSIALDCRAGAPAVASASTWTQGSTMAGSRNPGNRFGAALGASLVTVDTGDAMRLVVGAPGQSDGGQARSGTVTVLTVGDLGPVTSGSVAFGQGTAGIAGDPGVDDGFGGSLDATNALVL